MKFRTDISFLRALAVVIVMLFHFGVFGFEGGFIGVDVFFVISGFLMTQITINGFEKGNFSLKDFYFKRIKRIIPALQVVLLFVLLMSAVFFFQSDVRLNAKYVFLADFFISNIYFWKYQDYFSSTDNILLHTWTLGVEWQFYMFYPLLLLALRKVYFKAKRYFWISLSLICLISFLSMLFIGKSNTNFIFYMLPARFWELSIGGLAFYMGVHFKPSRLLKNIIVGMSTLILIISTYCITESLLWPSVYSLFPILSTTAILMVNADYQIFNNPIVQFLGNISYSLYLWHWPWFILFKYFGFVQPEYIVVLIIVSILSAYLSYRFIETKKQMASVKVSLLAVFIVAGLSTLIFIKPEVVKPISIYQNKKFEIGNFTEKYSKDGREKQFNSCGCFVSNNQTIKEYNFKECLKLSDSKPNVFLFGDSHAAQFSESLRKLKDYNIIEASVGYTFPTQNSKGKPGLVELNRYIYDEFLPKNKDKINLVLISAHWFMRTNVHLKYSEDEILLSIKKTIEYFKTHNIPYLIIGQTEYYSLNYPKVVMLKNLGKKEDEFYVKKGFEFNQKMKSIIPSQNFIDVYLNSKINHFDNKKQLPYMFDNNHLTTYGADQMVEKLILNRMRDIIVYNKQ